MKQLKRVGKWASIVVLSTLLFACKKDENNTPQIDGDVTLKDGTVVKKAERQQRLKVSLVGQVVTDKVCGGGKMQAMVSDPDCGFVDIGEHCVNKINEYRAKKGLPPFIRAHEKEICAAREAKKAIDQGTPHASDGCGWESQGAAGGGRQNGGTVEKSVNWVPRLFYEEGPQGGHYQAMMSKHSRYVACGFYAKDRNHHSIIINYYDKL